MAADSDDESWQGLTSVRTFNFNGLSVSVEERWGSSIGGSIWEGGVLLAEYLSHPSMPLHELHGRCIEVGAGITALPGLVAARLGVFDEWWHSRTFRLWTPACNLGHRYCGAVPVDVVCTDIEECMEDLEANIASNILEHHQTAAPEGFISPSSAAPEAHPHSQVASADPTNFGNGNIFEHRQAAAPQSVRSSSSAAPDAHQSSNASLADHSNAGHCRTLEHHQAAAQEASGSMSSSSSALHHSLSSEPLAANHLSVGNSNRHASEGMNQKQISGTALEQPICDFPIGDQSAPAAGNEVMNGPGDEDMRSRMCQQDSQAASGLRQETNPVSAGDAVHATSNGVSAAYRETGGKQLHVTHHSESAAETRTAATQLPADASKARAHAPQANGHTCQQAVPSSRKVSMDAADGRHAPGDAPQANGQACQHASPSSRQCSMDAAEERHAPGDAPRATEKRPQQGRCATRLSCTELDWENPAQIAALGTFDTILVADVVYILELVPALLDCLQALCHPKSVVYLAFYERSKVAGDLFWKLLRERFTSAKIPEASYGMGHHPDHLGLFVLRPIT